MRRTASHEPRARGSAHGLRARGRTSNEPQRICFVRKSVCCSVLLLTAALSACSLAGGAGSPSGDAGRRRALEYGLLALDDGEYAAAAAQLAPVAAICPTDDLGARALLLLAAAELDGRNPDGRANAAAELAAFQLSRSGDDWSGSMASELYMIALDLGADPIAREDIPDARVIWTRYLATGDTAAGDPLGDEAERDTLVSGGAEAERAERARQAAAIAA